MAFPPDLQRALYSLAELNQISKFMLTDANTTAYIDPEALDKMSRVKKSAMQVVEQFEKLGTITKKQVQQMTSADTAYDAFSFTRDIENFAKGGITDGVSIAGGAGPEAVVPLPDGKTIPVQIDASDYQPPSRKALWKEMGEYWGAGLIEGLKGSDQYSWTVSPGSIADQLGMAAQEMTKNGRDSR